MEFKVLGLLLVMASCTFALTLPDYSEYFPSKERLLKMNDYELAAVTDKAADILEIELIKYAKTKNESESLRNLKKIVKARSSPDIIKMEVENMDIEDRIMGCTFCKSTVKVAANTIRDDELTEGQLYDITMYTCGMITPYPESTCDGAFVLNYPIIDYVLKNTLINSRDVCSQMFQAASFCSVGSSNTFDFKANIDQNGPAVAPKGDIPETKEPLKILHLTDIHLDPQYQIGSSAVCSEEMCCRGPTEGVPEENAAGAWTDYRDCDSPRHLVVETYEHIKETHSNIDYIFFTGDLIDHAVTETTQPYIEGINEDMYNLMKEHFPDAHIFPTIGNHESQPVNQFAPDYITDDTLSTSWLYKQLADLWIGHGWLPESTRATIMKGGYYTVSPKPGYRVITINNNDCYTFNWWIFFDPMFLTKQLQFLHDTLLQAEKDGEFVHICAHVPSGSGSAWYHWSREYSKIIDRFHKTISGIFNGHTHSDEMVIYYSKEGNHPVNVAWNGGSLTPYSWSNPNYRVYSVEPTTMQVIDHETWIFNLEEANKNGLEKRPEWFKEYTFSESYETTDLSPKGLDELAVRMAKDRTLLRKYHYYKKTGARLTWDCSDNCLRNDLCDLVTGAWENKQRCIELQNIFDDMVPETTEESTTQGTTTEGPTTTCDPKDPDCDGAMSITAISLTLMLLINLCLKML